MHMFSLFCNTIGCQEMFDTFACKGERQVEETNWMSELPMGFVMALAGNTAAMQAFGRLPKKEQSQVVAKAKQVSSRQEMNQLVDGLV